jgi:hypothetical protein
MTEDLTIVPPSSPFLWQGKHHKITECGIKNYEAYASVEPMDDKLIAELERRIGKDGNLTLYQAFGYVCFVEDYRKMRAKAARG